MKKQIDNNGITIAAYSNKFPRLLLTIDCGNNGAVYRLVQPDENDVSVIVETTSELSKDAMNNFTWSRVDQCGMLSGSIGGRLALSMYNTHHKK